MTAIDQSSWLMRQLIDSCHQAHAGFQCAAEAVDDSTLKHLFGIYARQRTRFAQELSEHVAGASGVDSNPEQTARQFPQTCSDAALVQHCLDSEQQILSLYRTALADRRIPSRAHFLISAQCSLLQRVHDRMHGLLTGISEPVFQSESEREGGNFQRERQTA
jgi:uncharacterized protein (TIGR02284 family)